MPLQVVAPNTWYRFVEQHIVNNKMILKHVSYLSHELHFSIRAPH